MTQAKQKVLRNHLRTYSWRGAVEPAQIRNPNANGEGEAPMIDNPNAGQPAWCFEYGEAEWVSGVSHNSILTAATGTLDHPAQGRINCQTGAVR